MVLFFALSIFVTLIPFVLTSSIQLRHEKLEYALALVTGLVLCVLVFYPYWIFGKYSAIGWHDEFDLTIPWTIKLNQLGLGETFSHAHAGGTGVHQASAWVEKISILRLFFDALPYWLAGALYRIIGMFVLFSGIYISLRTVFGTCSKSAFFGAVVGSFISPITYGWALGGINWLYSAIAWVPYIFFCFDRGRKTRLTLSAVYGVTVATTTFPAFFLSGFLLFYFPLWFYLNHSIGIKFNIRHQIQNIFFLLIPIAINWIQLPQFVKSITFDSARLNRLANLEDVKNFLLNVRSANTDVVFFDSVRDLLLWGANYGNAILLLILFVSALILRNSKEMGIIYSFLISIVFLVFLSIIGNYFKINFIENYRWNQNIDNALIWIALASGLALSNLQKNYHARSSGFFRKFINLLADSEVTRNYKKSIIWIYSRSFYMVILCIIFSVCYLNIYRTMHYLEKYGGWGVFSEYRQLKKLKNNKADFRVISAGLAPKSTIPPAYSIDTFDGTRPNFSWRRSLFFKYVILKNYDQPMHTTRQYIFNGVALDDVNFNALNMVNIKYYLSNMKINIPFKNKQITEFDHGMSVDIGLFGIFNLMPPLFVYEIGEAWDRVFLATDIVVSSYTNFELGFYQSLQNLSRHRVVIAKNDTMNSIMPIDFEAKILLTRKELDGMTIFLNGRSSVLIYNQEYSSKWRVTCNETISLPVHPVNGVMMSVAIPAGCEKINFTFQNDL